MHAGLREVLFHLDSAPDTSRLLHTTLLTQAWEKTHGLSLRSTRENLAKLPGILAICSARGIGRLVLPITRSACDSAGRSVADTYFTTTELKDLACRLAEVEYGSVKVTVHDPFLWQAIHPKGSYHEEGCQAGNTFIYVTPALDVLACPLLPSPLGTLRDGSLRDILRAQNLRELRTTLKETPAACGSCQELTSCRGGCRGRAYVADGDLDARDPACLRVLRKCSLGLGESSGYRSGDEHEICDALALDEFEA